MALVAVLALLASSLYLHRLTYGLSMTVESLRLAEQIQADLLVHHHAAVLGSLAHSMEHTREAEAIGDEVLQTVSWAQGHASADKEHRLLESLEATIRAYLTRAARLQTAPTTTDARARALGATFDQVFSKSEELVDYHLEQARTARRKANVDAIAGIAAVVLALALIVAMVLLARSLRNSVFAPLLSLDEAIRSYPRERSRRAPESGAREVRAIAHAFNALAGELQSQRESQMRFLGGVAHDLRNPLGALKTACDVLSPERPLPGEAQVRRFLAIASRSVARLNTMVVDLLDITRVELGQLRLEPELCDLRDLAREAAELFELATTTHTMDLDLPAGPVMASCDPARIAQVLNNLVCNAIKYSPQGGVIRIAARALGASAVVDVKDPGLGIPEDEQASIFHPFRRSSSTTDDIPGVGLGLFTARQILEAHGGELTVDSTPGQGSCFRLRLPAPAPPADVPSQATAGI